MSVWLTESEFRQSGADSVGVRLNLAFFQEIKDEHIELRQLVAQTRNRLSKPDVKPTQVLDWLSDLRDELETYFALEEFYGYFNQSAVTNPSVNHAAETLQLEHLELFVNLLVLIDSTEQIIYQESNTDLDHVREGFDKFAVKFEEHERAEMELMMRYCNEEIGVGD